MRAPRARVTHGRLAALATAATGAGVALVLVMAAGTVTRTHMALARDEARMAASLWESTGGGAGGTEAVRDFLGDRADIGPVNAAGDAGTATTAPAYTPGALEPAARIAVTPLDRSRAWPGAATATALLGLLLMAAWATKAGKSPAPTRFPWGAAAAATAMLAIVAATAHRWADGELQDLSAHRASQGARTASVALANGADAPAAARAAGLPWVHADELDRPGEVWTMPREVARALAANTTGTSAEPPTPHLLRTNGARYHAARAGPLHLVALGYEDSASPTVALAASATAASLLVVLILFLLLLSARPRALRETVTAWAFLAPAAVLLALFTFGPLLFSLWISLHEWHLVDPVHPFAGLDNYRTLLLDANWWSAIRNTAVFTLHVPLAMAIALGLALLTQGSRRAIRWARLALFLPSITSVVAIAVVWKWLLNDGYGLVNRVLESAGLGSVAWLTSPDTALVTLMLISVWMVVGYQMVVFQAGLAGIPRDWYDAARVDGAGPLQRFRHITLPGLRHTLFFVLVTSVIGSFQVFGLVYVMTEGGPLGATDVAVYHIYREAWEFLRFGNAAAMSWILFAVVFAATWLHFRFLEGRTAHA